ncbi:hypothetical protein [Pseudomonas sp. PSKL.D1]|uniref:hypothetical protein n=1 Tax=Pseudomonas sp. PSKL.D1 TaxID=3029060 RepID=UPI0023818F32|nr:hypothetical protein [Pseudomonas sp. PSKL.D1]WDY56513.1 hypothetical protein PVV54_18190 [Pseudomonas sp. PSKL.D1]
MLYFSSNWRAGASVAGHALPFELKIFTKTMTARPQELPAYRAAVNVFFGRQRTDSLPRGATKAMDDGAQPAVTSGIKPV